MMTREEALAYGMSFDNVYEEKPFRDPNWQLVRIKGSKKTFLWIYEREGYINLNVKVNPEWPWAGTLRWSGFAKLQKAGRPKPPRKG